MSNKITASKSYIKFEQVSPPEYLNKKAQTIYMEMLRALSQTRKIGLADLDLVTMYSEYMAQFETITEKLANQEIVQKGSRTQMMINPLFRQQKVALESLLRVSKALGLTPSSRHLRGKGQKAKVNFDESDQFADL